MLAGHYAPAYAIKRQYPDTPLWQLFLGVQALDVLFFILVPLGVERMALLPGVGMPLALDLQFLPYSHSLVAALAWAGLAAVVGRAAGRPAVGIAVALAVFSHWVCDVLVHVPDVPVFTGDGPKLGFGLWRWPAVGTATELAVLIGAYGWWRPTLDGAVRRAADVSCGVLCVVQILNDWVLPPPTSVGALAVNAQLLYFAAAWIARRVDRAA